MKLKILKKCPHPSVPTKTLLKGSEIEVINEIGREYIEKGFAAPIARSAEDWEVVSKLGKQEMKRVKPKEEESGEE